MHTNDTQISETGSLEHVVLLALAVRFARGCDSMCQVVRNHCPPGTRPSVHRIPEAQRRAAADALLGELGGRLGRINRVA